MIGVRADDAAEQFAVADECEQVLPALAADQAVPVGVERDVDHFVRKDRRRPLDGVDLRHQRGVDQARLDEQLFVGPPGHRRILLEAIADGVVLGREQAVQHAEADPAVVGEAGHFEPLRIERQAAFGARDDLAVDARADRAWPPAAPAVDLRGVPPVRVLVDVGRRRVPFRRGRARRGWTSAPSSAFRTTDPRRSAALRARCRSRSSSARTSRGP